MFNKEVRCHRKIEKIFTVLVVEQILVMAKLCITKSCGVDLILVDVILEMAKCLRLISCKPYSCTEETIPCSVSAVSEASSRISNLTYYIKVNTSLYISNKLSTNIDTLLIIII